MRLQIFLLCCLMALCQTAESFAASGKCGSDLYWNLKDGMLRITGKGRMNDFGASSTPWRSEFVKYIEFDEGITYIGNNAFAKSRITNVNFPTTLTAIGERAFYNCKQLASVEMKFGVESIERMAFANCVTLGRILLPSTLRTIGDKAFYNCKSLSRISIPSRLHSLGAEALGNCTALHEISELPEFVTTSNCSRYGITTTLAENYLKNARTQASSVALVANTAPPMPMPVHGAAGTTTDNYGTSDVDNDVPVRPQNNTNTYAVIISNENYGSMADVPYSINDGTSFAAYCRMVLGIPDSNISFYKNASYGQMKGALGFLHDIDNAYNGNINVIFYYSGHGAPDEATKEAFLIPVDAYRAVKDVCLPLEELYASLGSLKSTSVKVFLDACFSGATRDDNMLAQARAVAVVPKKNVLSGNTVVISSSSDSQTSWQYKDQGHGLFTYYLLKKLKESRGDVSMGELSEYLSENVGRMSVSLNRKSQTPSANASSNVGRIWRSWLLRE